jgi:hypothetical protein
MQAGSMAWPRQHRKPCHTLCSELWCARFDWQQQTSVELLEPEHQDRESTLGAPGPSKRHNFQILKNPGAFAGTWLRARLFNLGVTSFYVV